MVPKVDLITDCQWGSTGKGLLAGFLAKKHTPDVVACALSPNAGHTYIDGETGLKLVHKMMPLGVVSPSLKKVVLGPGSLVDLDSLNEEIENLKSLGFLKGVRIMVHQNAAAVLDRHREAEKDGGTAPGSTRKGVGAAAIERIKRNPQSLNTIGKIDRIHPAFRHIEVVDTQEMQGVYTTAERIQVEGCQGYSLSMYHGQYPYCTSRDVTTTSLLADCGIPLMRGSCFHVYGTFRTYPIRVANRPESGEWSGPTYSDSEEVTFADLCLPQEYTTVTKLPRRIFTFSASQAREACLQNRVDSVFLNFAQYPPTWEQLVDIWKTLDRFSTVAYMGFGPTDKDVIRVGDPGVTSAHVKSLYEKARAALESAG